MIIQDEKELHETFSDKRIRGEWFDLSDDDIQNIIDSYSEREFAIVEGTIC